MGFSQALLGTCGNCCRWAALPVRLVLGIIFVAHGAQKVFGWFGGPGWSATIDGFAQMGLPAAVTVLVMLVELLGGLFLILGFLTRLDALGIAAVMIGAIVTVHGKNGFFMNGAGGPGIEYCLALVGLCGALLIMGGGPISVDEALVGKPEPPAAA